MAGSPQTRREQGTRGSGRLARGDAFTRSPPGAKGPGYDLPALPGLTVVGDQQAILDLVSHFSGFWLFLLVEGRKTLASQIVGSEE
jgi:hypothetical protein